MTEHQTTPLSQEQDPSRRQVSSEEGRRIAQSYHATYIETSALTGANVNEVFETLVRYVLDLVSSVLRIDLTSCIARHVNAQLQRKKRKSVPYCRHFNACIISLSSFGYFKAFCIQLIIFYPEIFRNKYIKIAQVPKCWKVRCTN